MDRLAAQRASQPDGRMIFDLVLSEGPTFNRYKPPLCIVMSLLMKTLVLAAFLAVSAFSQDRQVPELVALMQKYAADVQLSAGSKFQATLEGLNLTYAAALERAQKAAQEGGRLEEALAVKNEAVMMAGGGSVPSDDAGAPAALKNLRAIYRQNLARAEQEKAEATAPLIRGLTASLDQLTTTLTKAGRLQDAVVVKTTKGKLILAAGASPLLVGTSVTIGLKVFTNTLGMKFVGVPGTNVLFCIHETRRADYAAFAAENPAVDDAWKKQSVDGVAIGDQDDHPVVSVSWEDANLFCEWLGRKEGRIYRLPTDNEWSFAVGIGKDEPADAMPEELDGKVANVFPWGQKWPPPKGAGNYADTSAKEKIPSQAVIGGYTDGFATTAPVMSFKPNHLGLYDLGGNVWEWCDDWFNAAKKERVARGGSWNINRQFQTFSSSRAKSTPTSRLNRFGFRCVVVNP
jgi:hypothetical protein